MKILIVSATTFEVAPLFEQLGISINSEKIFFEVKCNHISIDIIITGVGMVATTYHTTRALLAKKYNVAINVGICGSFNSNLEIGSVVNVYHDCISELGAEDGERFLTLKELQLPGKTEFENTFFTNNAAIELLAKVNGITVNTVHGNEASIEKTFYKFHPIVESMEGAAFMMVCLEEKIPFVQVRAVSNFVEKRNKENWNIQLAIVNLNNVLTEILNSF